MPEREMDKEGILMQKKICAEAQSNGKTLFSAHMNSSILMEYSMGGGSVER